MYSNPEEPSSTIGMGAAVLMGACALFLGAYTVVKTTKRRRGRQLNDIPHDSHDSHAMTIDSSLASMDSFAIDGLDKAKVKAIESHLSSLDASHDSGVHSLVDSRVDGVTSQAPGAVDSIKSIASSAGAEPLAAVAGEKPTSLSKPSTQKQSSKSRRSRPSGIDTDSDTSTQVSEGDMRAPEVGGVEAPEAVVASEDVVGRESEHGDASCTVDVSAAVDAASTKASTDCATASDSFSVIVNDSPAVAPVEEVSAVEVPAAVSEASSTSVTEVTTPPPSTSVHSPSTTSTVATKVNNKTKPEYPRATEAQWPRGPSSTSRAGCTPTSHMKGGASLAKSAKPPRAGAGERETGVVRFVNDRFGFILRKTTTLSKKQGRGAAATPGEPGSSKALYFTVDTVQGGLVLQRKDVVSYTISTRFSKPRAIDIQLVSSPASAARSTSPTSVGSVGSAGSIASLGSHGSHGSHSSRGRASFGSSRSRDSSPETAGPWRARQAAGAGFRKSHTTTPPPGFGSRFAPAPGVAVAAPVPSWRHEMAMPTAMSMRAVPITTVPDATADAIYVPPKTVPAASSVIAPPKSPGRSPMNAAETAFALSPALDISTYHIGGGIWN